jgi:hypothetical protein
MGSGDGLWGTGWNYLRIVWGWMDNLDFKFEEFVGK